MAERVQAGGSVVFVLGGDRTATAAGGGLPRGSAIRRSRAFAMACEAFPPGHGTRLWLVTRPSGALPEPERPLVPEDAALWGAARVLANERTDAASSGGSPGNAATTPRQTPDRLALELLDPSDGGRGRPHRGGEVRTQARSSAIGRCARLSGTTTGLRAGAPQPGSVLRAGLGGGRAPPPSTRRGGRRGEGGGAQLHGCDDRHGHACRPTPQGAGCRWRAVDRAGVRRGGRGGGKRRGDAAGR